MFSKKKKNDNTDPIVKNNAEEQMNNTEDQINTEEVTAENPVTETEVVPELSAEEKLQQENAALNDKYLRLFAEFDNFKRRTQKERSELLQTAGKDVIVSLLPVLDDFDRATKAIETATDINPIREGVALVHSKLKSILAQKGLKEMESINNVFDTDNHEAITKIPAPNEELKGKVIDELEKGYTLNDKVIRFAKVVVGS
ncbi:nucleotide exchange factor GrpE [Pedobacter panaciterrae]|jgi:Molecular chaperone GrpE (heat shock protein)|uniref:Protein GrpE n=1 Tax=Pedobacter panaciterrae TaxID=363849 RepID=A0ABU8NJZ5_9SPHI|nr:nucleotide exchange factor GrpE [Pedobacter panaciterrae]NQX53794.1 nucleotide exchange factor GrpE [Pedobacter panaciterrae]